MTLCKALFITRVDKSKYDLLFTSDERYLTYYREDPVGEEAERYRVLKG